MTDAAALFRESRRKSGQVVVSDEARENMRRWLARMAETGWTPEDEAEYLQAVAEDTQDPERLAAAEQFWRSKAVEC
jgi:hypothetical protein